MQKPKPWFASGLCCSYRMKPNTNNCFQKKMLLHFSQSSEREIRLLSVITDLLLTIDIYLPISTMKWVKVICWGYKLNKKET